MSRSARKLLEQKKFDPLVATLSDLLGTDNTAALWVRAERRLDGLLKTTDGLLMPGRGRVAVAWPREDPDPLGARGR